MLVIAMAGGIAVVGCGGDDSGVGPSGDDGGTDALTDGSTDGPVHDGATDGSHPDSGTDAAGDSSTDGSTDGSSDGSTDGSMEAAPRRRRARGDVRDHGDCPRRRRLWRRCGDPDAQHHEQRHRVADPVGASIRGTVFSVTPPMLMIAPGASGTLTISASVPQGSTAGTDLSSSLAR